MRCWKGYVPGATFVSSEGRKAARIAGDPTNVSDRFSFLYAKLHAVRPGVIARLMLATLAGFQCSMKADESVEFVSVSTNTASVVITNASKVVVQTANVETNQISISANQPASSPSVSGSTNQPFGNDVESTASVTLVIQEKSEDTGPFSEQSGNGSFGIANIEAGFGQAYESDSIVLRGRNGTAWEETRYFFFKKVVKF